MPGPFMLKIDTDLLRRFHNTYLHSTKTLPTYSSGVLKTLMHGLLVSINKLRLEKDEIKAQERDERRYQNDPA